MYRVINEDLTSFMEEGQKDIITEFNTYEEAIQCEIDNYLFNTSIEQLIDGEWQTIAVNSIRIEDIDNFI